MNQQPLNRFSVRLHHRSGKTPGRIEVKATCAEQAPQVAIEQTIEISYPNSKPADWVVDGVTPL